MNERDLKFFRPLWLRVLITGGLAALCGFDIIVSHDQLWLGIEGLGVAYCVWNFFIKFPKSFPETPVTASAAEPAAVAPPEPESPKQP